MPENNDLSKENKGLKQSNFDYWKPVMFFYVKTTSWIILPLVLSALAGGYVSKSVGSQVVFFIFVMLGFLVTCLGIYREIKNYKKSLDPTSPETTKGQVTNEPK